MNTELIEAAYLIGFEPSKEGLPLEDLLDEVREFLMQDINN